MALITIIDSSGRAHLVHTSIFDERRPPRLTGTWVSVWARLDAARKERQR